MAQNNRTVRQVGTVQQEGKGTRGVVQQEGQGHQVHSGTEGLGGSEKLDRSVKGREVQTYVRGTQRRKQQLAGAPCQAGLKGFSDLKP